MEENIKKFEPIFNLPRKYALLFGIETIFIINFSGHSSAHSTKLEGSK